MVGTIISVNIRDLKWLTLTSNFAVVIREGKQGGPSALANKNGHPLARAARCSNVSHTTYQQYITRGIESAQYPI